jgi:hypothetical protein
MVMTTDEEIAVAPLVLSEVPAVAHLLARAMARDPAYRFLFPDSTRRQAGLADFFARNLRVHLPFACTQVLRRGGAPIATVTLRPPGGISISTLTMIRHGLLPFAVSNGRAAVRRLFWLKEEYEGLEARMGRSMPYWHVHMMAVDPSLQGRGYGSRLLSEVLFTAGKGRLNEAAKVLTTHEARNVVFYRRAGFVVTDELTIVPPGTADGYRVWCMRLNG